MEVDKSKLTVRPISPADRDPILEIDRVLSGKDRKSYIEAKIFWASEYKGGLFSSFVAEYEGQVVGFVMGEVYLGAFGIPEDTATIDTIGVLPEYQKNGIARLLLDEYRNHARAAGVKQIHTLVAWRDWELIHFFDSVGFSPAKTLSLAADVD